MTSYAKKWIIVTVVNLDTRVRNITGANDLYFGTKDDLDLLLLYLVIEMLNVLQ